MAIAEKLLTFSKRLTSIYTQDITNRFDFVDGYRGSLALVVVIFHSHIHNQCELVNFLQGYSQSYSISGFFMLSAFLLTYRLLMDFNKTMNSLELVFHILKYFIRRFFRIYVFYVLFYAFAMVFPIVRAVNQDSVKKYGITFWTVASLNFPGSTHLWTLPVEIKYYDVIPVFCLMAHFLGRFATMQLAATIIWTIWDQHFNFFNLAVEETMFTSPESSQLKSHFAVFLIGSEAALALFLIEKQEFVFIKSNWFQIILNFSSLIIGLNGLREYANVSYNNYTFKSRPAIYWSICLLMCMLNNPNMITNFFSGTNFLKRLGKYSFSCYLLHVALIIPIKTHIDSQPKVIIASVVISYYVAMISFHLIEKNLINLANFFCSKIDALQNLILHKNIYKRLPTDIGSATDMTEFTEVTTPNLAN